jgi:methylglyoxal synthase
VHQVPLATNPATAEAIVAWLRNHLDQNTAGPATFPGLPTG